MSLLYLSCLRTSFLLVSLLTITVLLDLMTHLALFRIVAPGLYLGLGHRHRGSPSLYVLDTLRLPHISAHTSSAAWSSSPSTSSFTKWHHRLGHLCGSRLSNLINKGCLGPTSIESSFHCKGCKLGKQIQLPYSISDSHAAKPFDHTHSDVWGPAPFATRVVINIMLFSLMIILDILGFTYETLVSIVFYLPNLCSHGTHSIFYSDSSFSF